MIPQDEYTANAASDEASRSSVWDKCFDDSVQMPTKVVEVESSWLVACGICRRWCKIVSNVVVS